MVPAAGVSKEEGGGLLYGVKLSSVGPGKATAPDVVHEPTDMDLAMKLHYLRCVYYFRSQAVEGFTMKDIKEPMFTWLNNYYWTNGRFRRTESGRPYIKCNDCGARFIQAHSVKSLDEWLEMVKNDGGCDLEKLLAPDHVLGPELQFSPPVFFKFTRFKCGGMSVGLSWAHVLGDVFSASEFFNGWGQAMAGHDQARRPKPAHLPCIVESSPSPTPPAKDALSIKRVGPVGDHWIATNNTKMVTFSLHLNTTQVKNLQSKVHENVFESICATIWKCVAKIRAESGELEPRIVTICKKDPDTYENGIFGNTQVISVVKADFSMAEVETGKLVKIIINKAIDERSKIKEAMEKDQGLSDFVVYGANLTFVDMQETDLYGLELKGEKPVFANCFVDGVGDEGVVSVLPDREYTGKDGNGGRVVTLTVAKDRVLELKKELADEFALA